MLDFEKLLQRVDNGQSPADVRLFELATRGDARAIVAFVERLDRPDLAEMFANLDPHLVATAWYETRDPRLARGHVAREPPLTAVVTALKAGCYELSPSSAEELLRASLDRDPEVSERARNLLHGELPGLMLDQLTLAALRSDVGEVWQATPHLPEDEAIAVVYLLLTGREDEAEDRDPDGELLRQGSAYLPDRLRRRLTAVLRKRGRGHLVTMVLGLDWRNPVRADRFFDELLPELLGQERYGELWRLAFLLPVHRARSIGPALSERGFDGGPVLAQVCRLTLEPVPSARPLRKLAGSLLAWGGARAYLASGSALVCVDWQSGEEIWRLPIVRGQSAKASPDGRYLGLERNGVVLLGPEGTQPIKSLEGHARMFWTFSPCSRYVTLSLIPHSYHSRSTFHLYRLSPCEVIFEDRDLGWSWQWQGDRALHWSHEGPQEVVLATGETHPFELPFESLQRAWLRSPSGERWTCSDPSLTRVWQDGWEQRLPGGTGTWLADDRLVLNHARQWSVWDGRFVRSLSYQGHATVDPLGGRLLGGDQKLTEVVRLSEPRLARAFAGRFLACHPSQPYVATQVEDETWLWHAPHDLLLARATFDDLERLEPHDRALARILMEERYRHEIAFEDGSVPSGDYEIELDQK